MREAFRKLGHEAYSCDLLPADDGSPHHYQCDIFKCLDECGPWDLVILHPTCTYLTVSGLHWNKRDPARALLTEEAIAFVKRLASYYPAIPKLVIENPVGCLSTRWMKPTQIIQPYQFGDDASKKTCLWIFGDLPKLAIDPAKRISGRKVVIGGKEYERWSNQTDSGQNKLPPSKDRWKLRSETYPGVASACAEAWG